MIGIARSRTSENRYVVGSTRRSRESARCDSSSHSRAQRRASARTDREHLIDAQFEALATLSATNATLTTTNGTAVISIVDVATQQVLGSTSVPYVIRGTFLYAQDPVAVHDWLQQFANYADIDVVIGASDVSYTSAAGSTSIVTVAGVYQGLTYSSGTVAWDTPADPPPPPPPCPPTQICSVENTQ